MYRLPSIRRARDFRLYAFNGERYLDLWLNQGRAYWGHSPKGLRKTLKNRISPALFSPFPHPLYREILGLVSELYPGYQARFFRSQAEAQHWLEKRGFHLPSCAWGLLAWEVRNQKGQLAALLRPDMEQSFPDYLCPILPLPAEFCGALVLVRDELAEETVEALSAFQLAGWRDCLRCMAGKGPRERKLKENELAPPADLGQDSPGFERRGRYLVPKLEGERYFEFYKFARSQGIILNPRAREISILPAWASPGEWARVQTMLTRRVEDE